MNAPPVRFGTSKRSSIGVEWEVGLVSPNTGDLAQVAPQIIEELLHCGNGKHIKSELLQNTVELATGVCSSVTEAGVELQELLDQVRDSAQNHNAEVIGGGMHPLARWQDQLVTPQQRYIDLVERSQIFMRHMVTWGLHVHVGVEDRNKVLPLVRGIMPYYPHLLALSASSPYWEGVDTQYGSTRSMLFQQLPTAGIPYQFDKWSQLESFADDMRRVGVAQELNDIHWDVRPSPAFGTIEIRICDAPTNLTEVLALAALTHCLVEHLSTQLDRGHTLPTLPRWYIRENKWRAARYGLDTTIITDAQGTQRPAPQAISELLTLLEPTAQRLQCTEHLAAAQDILNTSPSYERQRAVAHATDGDLTAITHSMMEELKTGKPMTDVSPSRVIPDFPDQNQGENQQREPL